MNDAAKEVPLEKPWATQTDQSPRNMSKKAMWDWAIWIAGLIYLALVLALNLYSPAFGVGLIVVAAYEVIEPRCRRRGA